MTDKAIPARPRNPGKSGGNLGKSGANPGTPITTTEPHEQPQGKTKPGHLKPARRLRCGAKARSTGKPCRSWALAGRTRCRKHGGATPRGEDSPNWKHGLYSSVMPKDLADLARRAKDDPTLRDMREQIALVDVRIVERLKDLHAGAGDWDAAAAAVTRLKATGDRSEDRPAALAELERLVTAGRTRDRAWGELREMFQERDKLLTGEVNRHKATADTINADRVSAMMIAMIDALRDESDDRDLLRRVFAKWERIMGLVGVTATGAKGD